MGTIRIEFYRDQPQNTVAGDTIYGRLISSVEDATTSTTPEHATIPGGAVYARVVGTEAHYIECGVGNQSVATGRRALALAGAPYDLSIAPTDTRISYASVA